jgi:hypothetical protein
MSHTILIAVCAAVCPGLALARGLQALAGRCGLERRGWGRLSLLSLAVIGFLAVPVLGIPIAGWVRGLNANFSLPLTGLLAAAVWQEEFRVKLLAGSDWTAGWAFGSVAGLGLYPLALGWGNYDPYEWGWRFSPLFVASAGLTGVLLWKRNRFGLVLLLAILAYHLRLLESSNYWDYLLDPVYWVASLLALGWRLLPRTGPVPFA